MAWTGSSAQVAPAARPRSLGPQEHTRPQPGRQAAAAFLFCSCACLGKVLGYGLEEALGQRLPKEDDVRLDQPAAL